MSRSDRGPNRSASERDPAAALILRRWRWACAAYLGFIAVVVALADQAALPLSFAWPYDTMMHFLLFGTAGWLLHRALDRKRWGTRVPVGPTLVAMAATVEEASQFFVAARTFAVSDLAANLAGIAASYALDELWQRHRAAARRPLPG